MQANPNIPDPNVPHPLEGILEASILQGETMKEQGEETNTLLEALIMKENSTEPFMEAQIIQDKQIGDKIVEAIKELKPELEKSASSTDRMVNFLEEMKGEKGDTGETGEVGPQGESIKGDTGEKGDTGDVGPMGPQGEKGEIGPIGKSGSDGIDRTDGKKGAKGDKGNDGSPDTPKDIKDKLETLKGKKRLNISAIDGLDKMQKEIDHIAFGSTGQEYRVAGTKVSANSSNLNFIAGSNTTITGTPTSDGADITITATGGGGGAVDSVNSQTGVVVLNQDNVLDGTTYKQYSQTEKTKLSGIETSADVTDTANVTSAGALMDSEVTNLAQVKAFSSADYATAAQGTLAANAIPSSQKGANSGVAELDAGGKVPAAQLPSYVDDVIEVANFAALPVTGETGIIYVTIDTNLTYRWSGTAYVEISASLALGETSSTAYRGDRGKIAYDHSLLTTGNPHNVVATQITDFDTEVSNNTDVTANTAKVTNATHSGDATGATALTLATVNSNVGSFTNANVTVNAKGLITAASTGSGGSGTVTSVTSADANATVATTTTTPVITIVSAPILTTARTIGTATGDVTSAGSTFNGSANNTNAFTIATAAVTLAKMDNLAQDQFIGRTTASTGVPQTATITAASRTVLDDTTVGAMVDTLGGATSTGTGGIARATSPVFTTPNIGSATGSISGNAATVTTNANLTGPVTSIGNATAIADAALSIAKTSGLQTALDAKELSANKDATGGYAGLTLFKINFKNALNTITSFFTNANTVARTYTFQDRDGTIADNTDLALKANLASPSFTGTVTATNSTDSNSVQVAILQGDRATFTNNDAAYTSLQLSDNAGTQVEVARIQWAIPSVAAGAVTGRLDFAVRTAGTLANELQLSGADLSPATNDGIALGTTSLQYSDLFLASGSVIDWAGNDLILTHTSNALTLTGGDLLVSSAGTASGSVLTSGGVQPMSAKRITKRVVATTQAAEPVINTDVTDVSHITALAQAITSFTTNLTGTPVDGDTLRISITDNGTARALAFGASFEASTTALPTTTVISTRLDIGFVWNTESSKWRCVAVA